MAIKQARDLKPGDVVTVDNGGIRNATIQRVEVHPNNVRVHFTLGYLDVPPFQQVTVEHADMIGGAL